MPYEFSLKTQIITKCLCFVFQVPGSYKVALPASIRQDVKVYSWKVVNSLLDEGAPPLVVSNRNFRVSLLLRSSKTYLQFLATVVVKIIFSLVMARLSRASEVIMVNLINCYLFTSVRSSNSFTVSKASRVVSFTSTTSPVSSMGPKKIPLKTGLTPARINLCAPIVLLCPPCHHPPRERRHQGEDQSLKRGSSANQSPSQTFLIKYIPVLKFDPLIVFFS